MSNSNHDTISYLKTKGKPWPWFEVKVSVTSNPTISEVVKIQAKNKGMAEFLALRNCNLCKQYGCGQVDNVKVAS